MVLKLDTVSVRYSPDAAPAVKDCNLSLQPGEKVALVGCNGSGKSSLLMAIVGLIPHSGDIQVNDTPVTKKNLDTIRSNVGFLFSIPDHQLLFPDPVQDIGFALTRRGYSAAEARHEALGLMESLDIAALAGKSTHALSHGQRMRMALTGTIITKPPLLLLDEPSGGLDPPGRTALARQLGSMDSAMLMATHDLDFARQVCNRWILLEEGNITQHSSNMDTIQNIWE